MPAATARLPGAQEPMSFAQQRLWFLSQLDGGGEAYVIPRRVRLKGRLDRPALARALERIVARHEVLRTTFHAVDGELVQRILPPEESTFPLLDHDLRGDAGAEPELRRLFAEEAAAPFDLERAPPVRGRLVRLADDEHALLLTFHHIAFDGRSLHLFGQELSALYGAFSRGEPDPLPPVKVQYADYTAWQRRRTTGEAFRQQVEYWQRTLAGAPAVLALPADRPRPAQQDFAGGGIPLVLDEERTERLEAVARRHDTTLFTVVLAGWAATLSRLSGQEDLVVGIVAANRDRPELRETIGLFANTLAVRLDLSGSPTVAELLGHVKSRQLSAREHQDVPFEQVVEVAQPVRSPAYPPLVQTLVSWQNGSEGSLDLPGLAPAPVERPDEGPAKWDLTLRLGRVGGRIVGGMAYAAALFERATVERYAGCLHRVLEAMAAGPERRVSALEMLPEAERVQVLEEWNATAAEYPRDVCVHELFAAQAARTPDAAAVVCGDESLSYAELDVRANRLAHHLRAQGVGPDARVGLLLERGVEAVVGVLAILKAGAAYVALEPSDPDERLRFVLRDAGVRALLTRGPLVERVAGWGGATVRLDTDAAAVAQRSASAPAAGVRPENLAYVIYTSGSTGTPKGVLVEHRGLCNYLAFFEREVLGAEGFALPLVSRLSFDAHVRQLYPPLLRGEAVWVLPEEKAADPVRLLEALGSRERVSFGGVPSLWSAVLDALDAGEHPAPEGLRAVLLGGEALPAELARRTRARFPEAKLWNHYGPTEATVNTTVARVTDPERVTLGRPIANVRVYLLDGHGSPVPVGVAGELYVGGVGVSRGYLGRAELTAERFVPDPFRGEPGARMYRSGDRVRWLATGELEFLGRMDQQVKIRGFRIELGEVEARLLEHAAVREAVVAVREETGDARLVAYWAGEAVEAEALRAHLSASLPEHMVPSAYVWLAALPLTSRGKVDRRALPAPEGDAYARGEYEAPVGEVEAALAEIWAEVLKVERVGRWDHFFELGGHSLRAVQVVSRVRQWLGVEIPPGEIFHLPVLAGYAGAVAAARRAELAPIEPADRTGTLALSFAQQRLWLLEQMGAVGAAYHVPMRLRLKGDLDRPALAGALERIVARHEALRTTFHAVDGEPVQRIAPAEESGFPLVQHDLRGHPHAETELDRLMAEEVGELFDLERGPLVRGRLVRMGEEDHVLLVTLHHVVSDGWSMGVFTRELGALYGAFRRGEADPLPPLPVQYADYAAWQRRWVEGEVLRQQAEYWKETLRGAPERLELPTDHPRPAEQDFAGAGLELELDAELTAGLKALSRRQGTTLFMTLLAGWAVVLSRLSGQEEVVVGTPTANRGRAEIEGLIGFFVNTLALRLDLSGAPGVGEVLERVKERALGAQQHQDVPFEQVVELVNPVRSLAHSPLFQVMFALQNAPREEPALPGLTPAPLGHPAHLTAKFDLSLHLSERGGRIAGGMEYATSLFERATVERYAGYLRRVLEAMAAGPERRISALELLSGAERRQVLEEWNATAAEYPREVCVHELFAAQAARTPDAVALRFGGRGTTYRALDEAANRLAHHLIARGVGPEVRVGIFAERAPETVVALLAVLKAGGAYVPLDPSYPAEWLRSTLADAAPRTVIAPLGVPEGAAGLAADLLDLRAEAQAIGARPAVAPGVAVPAEALAYVIYTSGSTGRPKGVMVPHGGVSNLIGSARESFGTGPGSRVLQAASLSFDASVLELFLALTSGAALVGVERATLLAPGALAAQVREEEVDTWVGLPALLDTLSPEEVPGLRTLVLGGERCGAETAARWAAGRALYNAYAPTEGTIYATLHRACGTEAPPVGRPVRNLRAYVLDPWGNPAPVGAPGEVHLGGAGVVRGYHARPELTAERFLPDPFGGEPGARMYRTGDRGRWRGDGELEFLGRMDRQVKLRGYRIELGEIEVRLLEHVGVHEAVVAVREDASGDARLVAYWVGEGPVEVEALRAHLSAGLPEYMVPAAYVKLEALPLTPSGKVGHRALPAPEGDAYARGEYEAPVGEVEAALAEIWAEVLKVERVGRWDHFFELGGHSLRAVQVVSRVRRALRAEVALGDLFARPVLADFARGLERAARAELPAIEPAERGERVPLSFAQQRLWFLHQMGDAGRAYHVPMRLRLKGELDRPALAGALERIVARHEALRTTFHAVDGEPVQRIAPAEESGFPLVQHDLRGHPHAEAELDRLMAGEVGELFDLERGPLVRGRLVRMGEEDHVLLVTLHHVVSDGWSMGVFTRELGTLYGAFRRGEADPLPPLPVQYADYAAWQRRWVEGEVLRQQAEYWKETLRGAPERLELPTDHPRPAEQDFAGAGLELELDAELTAGLKALSRRQGTTLFMTLLAGWAVVLSRLSGQEEVVVGTPAANRGRAEIEGLIGFFVNTLALRLDLSGAPGVGEVLERVKERALGAQQHQDVPFEQVVELVNPARSLAHSPLFQVMFALQNAPREELALPGLTPAPLGHPAHLTAKFDLSLSLAETGGRITGGLTYATALFGRATVERYAGYLRRVLEAMAAGPERRISALELLSEAERRQVLEEWSATAAEYPREVCVHELFEAQAARTPDAVAVVHEDRALTYAELNTRANRLAHHLRELGVEPDVRVGICVERGPEMVVGVLGVLKAGGAYVPLDPAYPGERLRYMLRDSAPAVLLTEAALAGRLGEPGVPVLLLGTDAPAGDERPETNPERAGLTPEHLAYVIYTSGSTGTPKGVRVEHRSLAATLSAAREDFGAGPAERIPSLASFAFDIWLCEAILPLLEGGTVRLVARERVLEMARLVEELSSCTAVHAVPALMRRVVQEVRGSAPGGLRGLRRIFIGGEAVPPGLLEEVREVFPGADVHVLYGPTEGTIICAAHRLAEERAARHMLGRPLGNAALYVLDGGGEPVPVGVPGELCIGGAAVARDYLGRPELTAEHFVPDPFGGRPGARIYRTGDRVRWLASGELEFLGRTDRQVKVRGFRIEPGEVEARLAQHPGVREAVVVVREDAAGERRLVAYYVGAEGIEAGSLRAHLGERLPEYMAPSAFVRLEALPLTPNGKVDHGALPAPGPGSAPGAHAPPSTPTEELLARIWGEVLELERVGVKENFFDLGGHSLSLARVQARLRETLGREVSIVDLFRFPTVASLAGHLAGGAGGGTPRRGPEPAGDTPGRRKMSDSGGAFAVVGMAGRFPGAPDVERFWSNLRDGVHSVTFFSEEELEAAGTDPALLRDPAYVRARGVLEGIELFDAGFFGFNPREAEVLDPQQRIFLETAWEALENAGYGPGSASGRVGIYAGSANSDYLTRHVRTRPDVVAAVGTLQVELGNGKDFLASRAAYKLNLRGPAFSVQTACSTGLVAVHLACQALAAGECDVALAGGVGIRLGHGHLYSPGGIVSPDGYCRAFDARAAGTVGGSGVGLVVLRRLEDALADGDTIRAVVRGSAINNDGAQKVGFTAPSVDAQAEVIARALALAGVDPDTVGLVEAHGSGTELGDPVEVAALTQAFGAARRREYCALGSVKTNIGHLDAAAGAAGLIKAVLALEHGEIPPTLHYTEPNPRIGFADSPFFVNTGLRPWPGGGSTPRRAGVSSLGIGGTNAHVVLEEAPPATPSVPSRPWHLLTLSARTPAALEAATDRLAAHLGAHPEQALADVAYTLQVGREAFGHRRVLVARDPEDAARALETRAPERLFDAAAPEGAPRVAFVFPGLGNHHSGMARGLYETEPVFRETVDRCAEVLRPHLGLDLREVLYPGDAPAPETAAFGGVDLRAMLGRAARDEAADPLADTRLAQPALFVTEYALARLWMHWGVQPQAMVGHSLGEYVAATVAGVWSLEDALALVAERARLISGLPPGGMMGLPLTEEDTAPFLRDGICIGAKNGPEISVVSGPLEALDALQAEMEARGIAVRRLPTRHAFHSGMMEPVAERLEELLRRIPLHPPKIPFASNVTGGWIRASEATDPEYWTRHLCRMVRFSEGVETIARDGCGAMLELGPGNTVGGLALQLAVWGDAPPALVVSLPHRYERHPDSAHLLGAAGRLWAAGVEVDWRAVHAHERLRRVPLPTYPFERSRYWIEPRAGALPEARGGDPPARRPDPADWLYLPLWRRAPLAARVAAEPAEWLVLADGTGIGSRLAGRLEEQGHTVVVAEAGDRFARVGDRGYTVRPGSAEDMAALRDALHAEGTRPRHVVHLWGIGPEAGAEADAFGRAQARGYATVAALAGAFARDPSGGPLRLVVVTEGVRDVSGGEPVHPERATVLAACLALPQEHPHVACRTVDVRTGAGGGERLAEQLAAEVTVDSADFAVALRGPWRWALDHEAVRPPEGAAGLRAGGAYLFSGSMAGGAEVLAEHLAGTPGAGIAVVVDPSFPERGEWDACLSSASGGGAAVPTIRGLRAAEARGARTLLLRAAPGDAAAMRAAVAEAREAFGALHGVVHAAGVGAAEPTSLAEGRPAAVAAELARVTHELSVLDDATAGLPLDFRLLQNSIFSVFGGAGLAAATAAFVLTDAWAQRRTAEGGGRWTSVSWDRWHLDGGGAPGGAFAEQAIQRGDGARVFECLAALAEEPRVVVSTHDLRARLARLRAPRGSPARPAADDAPDPGLHTRPALGSEYLLPGTEAEEILAGIWRELLGIREIGVRDNFFDLGGHSLLGIQLLARVREAFQVELPLHAVFEAPTIAGLAGLVDEAILQELDAMSDEEAEAALAALAGQAGPDSVTRG